MRKLALILNLAFTLMSVNCWADSKLSALSNNSAPTTSDLSYDVASGTSYNVNWAQIFALLASTSTTWTAVQNYTANVGIGSTNPGQVLDVAGTVRAQSFTATGTGYSDFTSNVGIGSATPGSSLDVQGTVRILGQNGLIIGSNSGMINTAQGSIAGGIVTDPTGLIEAVSPYRGCMAYGHTELNSFIECENDGAIALGEAAKSGIVTSDLIASGPGSFALGQAEAGVIQAEGNGSFAMGHAANGNITATNDGSNAWGDNVVDSGSVSWALGTGFTNSDSDSFQVGFSATPTLTVETNVGIGTVGAPNKLYVAGTAEMQGFKMNASPSSGYVLTSNSVGVGTWAPASGGGGSGTPGGSNPQLQYNQAGSFGGVTGSGVDSNGNVGIGSVNPQYPLVVNGTGYFSGAGNVGIGTINPQGALTVMNGNVGIGTWKPAQLFDIKGNALVEGSNTLYLNSSSGSNSAGFSASGGTLSIESGTTNNIVAQVTSGAFNVVNGYSFSSYNINDNSAAPCVCWF